MDQNNFIERYSISDAVPREIKKSVYTTTVFSQSVSEFIEENFKGLAEVECCTSTNLSIMVSEDYSAYFFKKLLSYVYGKNFVKISFFTDDNQFNVEISSGTPLQISHQHMNDLIRQARNAGFEVHSIDGSVTLATPILKEVTLSVYAIPAVRSVQIIKQSFIDIFFYNSKEDRK
jgi:hypothetical protein